LVLRKVFAFESSPSVVYNQFSNSLIIQEEKANEIITVKEVIPIAVITVTSGLDTQTRVMGHFPLY